MSALLRFEMLTWIACAVPGAGDDEAGKTWRAGLNFASHYPQNLPQVNAAHAPVARH
jgi:hypothetical protein